uniref:7TM GPCR serpentine receptor class x (Srx) domain-containing protein n=1 Tax=Trichuris muris TaxID=70415 RepID=A0A5S6QUM4_TRIMR
MSRGMIALQIENDILIVLIILIYVVLLIWVEKELRKAKHDPDHLAITRTQMKVELLHTLAISISLFALTIAVANVLITVGIVDWENEDSIDYVRYSAIGYLGGIANFAVYYWRTKEIRKSFNYLVATMGRMAICKFDRKISVLPTTTSVAM